MDDSNNFVFRVEPQFIHRTLAARAFGVDETASLSRIADEVTAAIVANRIPDIRVAMITDGLEALEGKIATVRAGFFFRREDSGHAQRVVMHDRIRVGEAQFVEVVGRFDPARIEANSPHGNLSGRANALAVGVVQEANEDQSRLVLRPLLIGFPYYAPTSTHDPAFSPRRPEIPYFYVEESRLDETAMRQAPTAADLARVFAMREKAVKEAFGQILGLSSVPKDHGVNDPTSSPRSLCAAIDYAQRSRSRGQAAGRSHGRCTPTRWGCGVTRGFGSFTSRPTSR